MATSSTTCMFMYVFCFCTLQSILIVTYFHAKISCRYCMRGIQKLHEAVAMPIRLSIIMLSKRKFSNKFNRSLLFVSNLQWKHSDLFIFKICHISNPSCWNIGENLVFIFRHSFIQLLLMNTPKCHVWFCSQLLTENLPVPRGPVGLN